MLIAVEGMKFYAHHGYYDEERQKGNNFIVDVYLSVDLDETINDALNKTINYELVYGCVKQEMLQPTKLLETVAINILNELQKKCAGALTLRVRVSKLAPPLLGDVTRAYVELERKRN